MADNTAIEWADTTWNPLLGCERVSPGCDRCYAINTATIRAGNPHPKVAAAFAGLTERRDGRLDWTGRINLLDDRLGEPLGWKKPRKVFVNSQSDLFHKDVPDEFIARVFAVMWLAHQHTFQLLTKRHGRMRALLSDPTFPRRVLDAAGVGSGWDPDHALDGSRISPSWWPLPNVHLGVSVESQKWADVRVPALLDTPAAVRWLSMEPLLGPVDLHYCAGVDAIEKDWVGGPTAGSGAPHPFVDWVVVGGESGPGARPMHPDWARSLRDQCAEAGVPFFFKQWGEWAAAPSNYGPDVPNRARQATHLVFASPTDVDGQIMLRRGKKLAGRELDGRTWDEYPTSQVEAVA